MLVRQAIRVGGIRGIALTKLDVLDGFDEIKICTGYRLGGETLASLPGVAGGAGGGRAGLRDDGRLARDRRAARAPGPTCRRTAIKYIRRVEELIGAPVALLSTSPERDDTILVADPFAD